MTWTTQRICVLAATVLLIAGSAAAQSVYNLNLLGTRLANGDVQATALGGDVQIVPDTLGVLQRNPAILAYSKRVTFGAAVFSTVDENESAEFSDREGGFKFTALAFAFTPVKRLTMAIGYRADYDATGGFTTPDTTDAGGPFVNKFTRSGGMLSFPFSAAIDLGRRLKVGGYVSVENGSFDAKWEKEFRQVGALNSFGTQERTLRGTGWGAGVELSPWSGLGLGVTYEAEIEYDTDVIQKDTNNQANGSYKEKTLLPEKWIGSLRWRVLGGITIYAGGSYRDFTRFKGMAFPTERLAEEIVGSVGLEIPGALGSLPLWLSGTYEQLPYTLPNGENVHRVAATLGTGLRLGGGRGKIDLALQYAQMGSLDTNGFETRSVRFYLGIAGAEAWRRGRARR